MILFLFVKDFNLFACLLDQQKWPHQIGNENFTFPSSPSILPQLSLKKNGDFRTNMNEFTSDLRANYPEIKSIIRLKK